MGIVVGVHAGDEGGAAGGEAQVEGRDDPRVGLGKEREPGVRAGGGMEQISGCVGRAIVHGNHFKVGEGLGRQTGEGGGQGVGGVVAGKQDRDGRHDRILICKLRLVQLPR